MIPMNDFRLRVARLRPELDAAVARVLDSGWFILGQELAAFEEELARFLGVRHAVGVANGMEALELALMAAGVGPGDEVVTTPLSAFATTLAVLRVGATPVFADVEADTGLLDPALAAAAIGPRTRALLPVHLYGQAADLQPLQEAATRHGLVLIGDAAQAHGARYRGRDVAAWAQLSAYSFYPTKNLGALGDAGLVVTDDDERAARLRRLRDYGQAARYEHVEAGLNSRLDELQAALLRCQLPHLAADNERRRALAARYRSALSGLPLSLPGERPDGVPVYHQFVVRTPGRDALAAHLRARGVATLVHYPVLIPRQQAMAQLPYRPGSLPVAERFAAECLSLPIFPEMTDAQADEVAAAVRSFFS